MSSRLKRPGARVPADGILLLYYYQAPYATTVMEHVNAFARHSRFAVWSVNVNYGFPPALASISPRIVLLHYSLFGAEQYMLSDRFLAFLERSRDSYRIAFFQDEHQFCQQRFEFIDRYRIDCVYTLLAPQFHDAVYGRHTHGPRLIATLTGYVSDELVRTAATFLSDDADRTIDVGYRARPLPLHQGAGAQEKVEIAREFVARAQALGLRLDIATDEASRLYGRDWTGFLANSRSLIGVEAGVSIFDLTGEIREGYERLLASGADDASGKHLAQFENNIPYRTISPRHFEAAAFRVLQILFEGEYSGILKPMRHFLPLKKDFSNFDEVMLLFRDPAVRRDITERAYSDLIASGTYSYRRFIDSFDADLIETGLVPSADANARLLIARELKRGRLAGRLRAAGRPYYRRAVPHDIRVRIRGLLERGLRRVGRAGSRR